MTSFTIERSVGLSDVFHKTELAFVGLISFVFLTDILLSLTGDQTIAWHTFAVGGFACIGLIVCGCYMRIVKDADRGGKIVLMFGLNSLFAMMMAIFFHLHMPRPEPILTDMLLAVDHWFGYDWPSAVAWVEEVPNLGWVLQKVYLTSFFQIFAVMMMLTYLNRMRDLDAMIFANAIALILVFVVWQAFPNLSQSTYLAIPVETAVEVNLVTHSFYGERLLDMAVNGLPVVAIDQILGQVAFPSYHIAMAALVVWFSQRTVLFWPVLVLNIVMIPATLIHGAHHVADIIGGIVVLGVALVPAYMLVNYLRRTDNAFEV